MIYSDKQLGVSTREMAKLNDALGSMQSEDSRQEWVRKAEINALKSQIAELRADIKHYQVLKRGEITVAKSISLEELPSVLVQARIISGMSQSNLARALGTRPQQVQRYEAADYMGASLAKLIEVSRVLKVRVVGEFDSGASA